MKFDCKVPFQAFSGHAAVYLGRKILSGSILILLAASFQPFTKALADPAASPTAESAPAAMPASPAAPSAENEVLENILGVPPGETDTPKSPGTDKAEPGQKRFSFLDPEARSMLAPEFDYGVYSMNMRILDDYKRRIRDALETSRQLALGVPEEKVQNLMRESDQHKKKFEALYLNNQTEPGLQEFSQARRLILQALALTTASPKVEGRAIWLDRGTIVNAGNPEGVARLMQKLHKAGINIVYFETLNAGFPIYPSAVLKHNPMINGWDPLKAAVTEGHKLGMEVHAWVWVFAVGNRRHNPLIGMPDDYAGPILVEGGMMNEALRNREGGLSVDGRQHEYWLSPASPKAREFLLKVYREIVTNYDVDGLQLDYIRYPFQTSSTLMGFEPIGQERLAQSTGVQISALDDAGAKLWIAWKTYQVSSFVQQVSETLKKIKPDLKLSAAVFPMRRESRIVAIQQDWETWIDNGWIDTLSPMSYTSDPERLQGLFQYVQSSPQKRTLIYPGVALHRLDGGQLVLQLEALRAKGSLGATLFAGAHLDQEKIETLSTGPFKEAGSPPHRDVVKSLQTILADYREKFGNLQRAGNLPGVQVQPIQNAIADMENSLNAVAQARTAQTMQQAMQNFRTLQGVTNAWTAGDKIDHPFRAQYFDKTIVLLDELLGYLADKNGLSYTALRKTPASPSDTPPAEPAASQVKPQSTSTLESDADKNTLPN